MGVELFIHRKDAPQPEYYSLSGTAGWLKVWLPAAKELGLDLIPFIGDGTFSSLPPENLPEVMMQLRQLRDWMATHGHDLYVEHLDALLPALIAINPNEDRISFG